MTDRITLLRGGSVHTPADPLATAMLVSGERVAWVGRDGAADQLAAGADEVVDLDGALVTPAFVDAHVHTTSTGIALTGLDLSGAGTLDECLALVRAHAAARPGERVLLGHGWDAARWPGGRPPRRAELDEATGGRPLYLSRIDVHSAVVTSALLDLVPGIADRAGFSAGEPLTRDAHHAVRAAAYAAITPAQRTEAQRAALREAARLGICAVHECAGPEISSEDDLAGLLDLAREEPGPRVFGYWAVPVTDAKDAARVRDLGALGAAGDLFVDGALGSHTACLSEPYADAGHTGTAYLDADLIAAHVAACTEAGLQAGFHAIGDAAVAAVTEGVRAAAERVGLARVRAARHRVEHAEMLGPGAVDDLADLGLIASVQPVFDELWGGADGMYTQRLGATRARTLNPFAALLRAGVPLAFGSDSPVTPLGPWRAIRAAALHRTPEHRVPVRAGFTAHTRGGWRAVGHDEAGVLMPGAAADYAVWRVGELVARTTDERLARWSTDPRWAIPALPDLGPDRDLPVCLRTAVSGRTIFVRPQE
jgi:predicted amidohydrolase YtcJ